MGAIATRPAVGVAWAAVLLAGCVAGDETASGTATQPVPAIAAAPLSTIDCATQAATGYVSGQSTTISVVRVDGKPVELAAANAYLVMAEAAQNNGVQIRVVSGFRTYAEQAYLYGCYVHCNCNSCNPAAAPGYSNHQSGHALDLNTAASGVLAWLNAHAGAYGFTRTVPSESWHWEWWGGGPGGGPCGQGATCHDSCQPGAADRVAVAAAPAGLGYAITATSGAVAAFGALVPHGDLAGMGLNQPVVGAVVTPSGQGYWLAAADGGVFSFGDAGYHGSLGGQPLNAPVVGMAATPSGQGYWLVGADGGIFAFGDAGYHGSMGGQPLNAPVVGMARTPSGGGYWLVGRDGGIFAFGDAGFHGSMGGQPLNAAMAGIAATPSGQGYWCVGADGGIFAFGDAGFHGSMGGQALNAAVVGIAATPSGQGYWLVGADGGVFAFGDAPFLGSALSSRSCDGTTPRVCERGGDGCFAWRAEAACGDGCRNGGCAPAGCGDDCAPGAERCESGGVAGCGQGDADPCWDWLPASACVAGTTCVNGACVVPPPVCTDACDAGLVRCESGGVATCVAGPEGCRVWGASVACGAASQCLDGVCVADPIEPEPDTVSAPDADIGAGDTESGADTAGAADSEPGPDGDGDVAADTVAADMVAATDADAGPDADAHAGADAGPDAGPAPDADTHSGADADVNPDAPPGPDAATPDVTAADATVADPAMARRHDSGCAAGGGAPGAAALGTLLLAVALSRRRWRLTGHVEGQRRA